MLDQKTLQIIKHGKNLALEFVADVQSWLRESPENKLILYGAGGHLPWVMRFLARHAVPVTAILDSYRSGEYNGVPILLYDSFAAAHAAKGGGFWFFISAPSAELALRSRLAEDFPNARITCCEISAFYRDIEEYRAYLLEHWEGLVRFSDALEDALSQKTLASVLAGRITGDLGYYRSCFAPEQYYAQDVMRFSPGEVMVELGSFDGETLLRFTELCPDYKAVYCFEPEQAFLPRLQELRRAQTAAGKRMVIIPKGAWDSTGTLSFFTNQSNRASGTLLSDRNSTGSSIVEVTTVDEAVPERISFLKMDIEGAELRALRGAEKHIRADKPKLAVCVYHKAEDMLDIWTYLKALVPEYRFYLRQHLSYGGTETVLYCLCD